MGTREILSLQFGHYANFIGTHWWNLQESSFEYNPSNPSEICHDVLYREGLTNKGQVTFTPRLLLVDLKGSLKSLPESGLLDDPTPECPADDALWNEEIVQIINTTEDVPKNQFQKDLNNLEQPRDALKKIYNLNDEVHVWSDFLYTRFHPRTINVIREYEHESAISQFEVFPLGTNLWRTDLFKEEFSDKIRNYIEECDSFQGFHITLDATNGFSGLASSCIEYLKDEYDSKAVLAFPVFPSYYSDYSFTTEEEKLKSRLQDSLRVLNTAMCFDVLGEHSSLFVPLCTSEKAWRQPGPGREFHHMSYDHKLPYHTSAILASALDTLTLQYRLKSTTLSLGDLCKDLSNYGRKAAAGSICLPFSLNKGADFIDCLDRWEGPLTQSITPNCSIGTDKLSQMLTLRGISEDRLKRPLKFAGAQKDMAAYNCNTIQEMLNLYLSCNYFLSRNHITTITKGLPVNTPYPNIFDKYVTTDGNIDNVPRIENTAVDTVPVLAGLHSGSGIGDMIESLHTETRRIKFNRLHQFSSHGLESLEFNECLDRLFGLRECYEENYMI